MLEATHHPFMVALEYAFQTEKKLYLALEYACGGDLFKHLENEGHFPERKAQFYAAEILLVLEFLHSKNIIYRDLKPENVVIDTEGHIKLTDFGLAKELEGEEQMQARSFCGTNEYLAPEVILGASYGESVDWWALGVVIYQMLTGWPPWNDDCPELLFRKIVTEPLCMDEKLTPVAFDLLKKMLTKRIKERIKPDKIKKHPFFASVDFDKLLAKKVTPPFVPNLVYLLLIY